MVARCPRCKFMFEAATPGLLPPCPQCGGPSAAVLKIEAAREPVNQPRTLKFAREQPAPLR